MTSFVFEGPAIGGPANGRVLVSYCEIFASLYPVPSPHSTVTGATDAKHEFAVFRYRVQNYGVHCFFLPATETLEQFLTTWQPPRQHSHWPAFLQQAIEVLQKD